MNMGIAAFGVRKPVVVNLLMAALLITGICMLDCPEHSQTSPT